MLDKLIASLPEVDKTWKYFLLTEKSDDSKRVSETNKFDCIADNLKYDLHINDNASLIIDNNKHLMFQIDVSGEFKKGGKWNLLKTELNSDIWRLFSWADIKKRLIIHFKKNNILYCPFCGVNQLQLYKNVSNFDIDHFLPKSLYPQYAFSLYNLIPICKHCNQNIKRDRDPLAYITNNDDWAWYIFHPYFGWIYVNKLHDNKYGISLYKKEYSIPGIIWHTWYISNSHIWCIHPIWDTHHRYFCLQEIYMDSPSIEHDIHYMYRKRQNIQEQQARVKSITKKKIKGQLDRITEDRYPTSESETLAYPNGKMRRDLVEWMKWKL